MNNKSTGTLMVLACALLMGACGGGGGSPGTTGGTGSGTTNGGTGGTAGGTGGTTITASVPKITLTLFNGATATSSINASGVTTAKATVVDEKNNPVKGKLVTFTGDATLITFSPLSGAVLTDAVTGIATIQITPASLSSGSGGTLSASATVVPSTGGTGILTAGSIDYQLSPANLTLSTLDVQTSTPLAAYGTRAVSVTANINSAAATNTPVQITFTASCGTVTPATVTTDGTGKASSTYTANSTTIPGCAGANVNVTAAAASASSLSGTIAVQPTLATNIQFVSATPQLIYLVGSVGATQSQVSFKVVDSSGNPLQNQSLNLSLTNAAPGVSLGTVGNTSTVAATTNSAGVVSVPVFSGSIPTSLQVNAVLASNQSVSSKSNTLLVASGVPVQSATSIAAEKLSIEGLFTDGVSTNITLSLADRQGNPVPVGTSVNFVASSGVMVPATCVVPALSDGTSASSCTTSIRSQGTRPANGRVAILAYTPGEEDFVDANGNNVYDAGETFTDLGNAYRDDNFSNLFDTGEFVVPRAGTTVCVGGYKGRTDTCDGVWGAADVRGHQMVVFASGQAYFSLETTSRGSGIGFTVADVNGNSMPTGTTIAVDGRAASPTGACSATVTPGIIPNTVGPIIAAVIAAPTCVTGDFVDITVKSPRGLVTSRTLQLTP
ncbi:hypothetical protein [Actimicrobium antarcticum]|uniref:Big-1 domain-containing protein n=1 Tax=Actimicrobium antarcticum TaxID=1051899 RepID=A0ABP7TYC2_9BURK